jgi:hypothetical protein
MHNPGLSATHQHQKKKRLTTRDNKIQEAGMQVKTTNNIYG